MGYETYFQIETIPSDPTAIEHLKDCSGYNGWSGDTLTAKWYSHEEDIAAASRKHSDVLYRVTGGGEEQGGQWIIYAKAGEIERLVPEIVSPKSTIVGAYAQ